MPALVNSIKPIYSRVRRDTFTLKTPGHAPGRTPQKLQRTHLEHHLNGGPYVGCYPMLPGQSSTLLALLDLDSHKGDVPWADMCKIALDICDVLDMLGYCPIPFRSSGGHGMHIYLLWDEPQDAYSVREFLRDVLDACWLGEGTAGVGRGQVEIFPKQDSVPDNGFGNMFILPLAGASEPLCIDFGLAGMGKDYAAEMAWPTSPGVGVKARPERAAGSVTGGLVLADAELVQLRAALAAIPNEDAEEQDYDNWRNVVFALHSATGGSADGLALAHEFSSRAGKYDPMFLDERVWPYIKDPSQRGAGVRSIGAGTILKIAREHGWQPDVSGEFEVVGGVEARSAEPAGPLIVEADGQPLAGQLPGPDDPLPPFIRDSRGRIEAIIDNVCRALEDPRLTGGWFLGFDVFREGVMWTQDTAGMDGWVSFGDTDYVTLRRRLEREHDFKPISKDMMRDAVHHVARTRQFDSAQLWLGGLVWDGVPRIDTLFVDCFGVADSEYARACGAYICTAMAGRVLQPGIQADMVPILTGAQGLRKSTTIEALAPPGCFVELDLSLSDDNLARQMRGKTTAELAEMKGLSGRSTEHTRAFVTRKAERWTQKYQEFATEYLRRVVFFGTSNTPECVPDDPDGVRRWLPMAAGECDPGRTRALRNQLWAEGAVRFAAHGIEWQKAHVMAVSVRDDFKHVDEWLHLVSDWLEGHHLGDAEDQGGDGAKRGDKPFRLTTVLTEALNIRTGSARRIDELRAARILRTLGYEKSDMRKGHQVAKFWSKAK